MAVYLRHNNKRLSSFLDKKFQLYPAHVLLLSAVNLNDSVRVLRFEESPWVGASADAWHMKPHLVEHGGSNEKTTADPGQFRCPGDGGIGRGRGQPRHRLGRPASAENDPGGWLFNRDTANATNIGFNTDAASIGEGSLYVFPLSGEPVRKFIGEYFLATETTEVNSISYDFMIGAGGDEADAVQFYANVYANFPGGDQSRFGDCVYSIIPTSGSLSEFTTVTFDPSLSYDVRARTSTPCPSVPAYLGDGSTLRAFVITLGDTTANDAGIDGYFDNIVVDRTDGVTTYDFEPAAPTFSQLFINFLTALIQRILELFNFGPTAP